MYSTLYCRPNQEIFYENNTSVISINIMNKVSIQYMMNTPLLRSAIRVIYQLGECPNQLMESIIRVLVNSINENLPEWGEGKIAAHIIRRLCFIVGEVCLNQGCYLYF